MTKKRRSRKSKFELHFTMVNCLVLMVVFTATLGLYYHSLTNIYSAQLNRSNDSLVQQVGNSFEIVYTQIKDYLYQIPIYDQELAKFAQEYDGSAISKNHLIKKMDSITYGNHFLYSCYMYLDKHDEVFDSENGQFTSMDTFFDKSVFDKTSNQQIVVLPPHNIVNRSTKSLVSVISVLSPLPIFSSNSAGVIVFNINVDKLYTNIMKQLPVDNNMNMSIFSLDGNPIINGELVRQHFMGNATADQPKESDVIGNASYTSPSLKWVFQLQNKMSSQEITRTKFYSSLLAIIPAMAAAIFIVLLIIERLTKNVGRVLRDHDKNQLKVFLLNEGSKKVGFGQALQGFTQPFYHVITVQEILQQEEQAHFLQEEAISEHLQKLAPHLTIRTIATSKTAVAVILNHSGQEEGDFSENLAKSLMDALGAQSQIYVGLSSQGENGEQLPLLYNESVEALKYKIVQNSHILRFEEINKERDGFTYPFNVERQIVNNLMVNNPTGCEIFLNNFVEKLIEKEVYLTDSEIKIYILQLTSTILQACSDLPISVKINTNIHDTNFFCAAEMFDFIKHFIEEIIHEIERSNQNQETDLYNSIIAYLKRTCTSSDFNLNKAAEDLGMNRNNLSKLIKTKTDATFNEYIARLRISYAKELLHRDLEMPIEQIAYAVGYNYQHYFIRVFKKEEGVTPGVYREMLSKTV